MDLRKKLEQFRAEEQNLQWEGTFLEYFNMVKQQPHIADLAHARIYQMIMNAGITTDEHGTRRFDFFAHDLFGLEKPLEQLVEYFHSAARRLEVRKRILLLMGPVGGGKSTIVTLMKRGLEQFTRTDAGAVYAIKDCPMHEDPLHLIPHELRDDLKKEFGIYIEGDLCPACRQMLRDQYDGKAEDVRVERIAFSEKHRIGIGTFSPSDPKSQDISELTGSVDLSTIGQYGSESDPRAYRFDGELNIANRGMMEFIEMLKADEKFLYGLLTLSQEQSIKTGRFALIYADECIMSHTNENEYNAFVSNKKNEALKDRMILIKVPYNLRVNDEVKIYEKLLGDGGAGGVHVAPHALKVASIFAILTRLEPSRKAGLSLMKKLKLYNGETVEGFTSKDVRDLQEEVQKEGMIGISPRYVINRISTALVKDQMQCIGPLDVLRSLKDGFEQHTGISKEEREQYLNFIYEARKEYDEIAKNEVQRAFIHSFEEQARAAWESYLDNVEAFCNKQKTTDPITGDEVDPDEKFMRSIEEQIGVTENAKKAFREEILIRISTLARKGQRFDYTSHDRLREAIERKLFADLKNVVKMITSLKTPDPEQQKKVSEVTERLVEHHGYCQVCADELLRYVGTLLSR